MHVVSQIIMQCFPHNIQDSCVLLSNEYIVFVQSEKENEKESGNETRHDKTNKMAVRPAKTQISLGIRPVWSDFAVRIKKAWVLNYPLSAQRRLWSDWADAQPDPSLLWARTHFAGFVMSWLKLICFICPYFLSVHSCSESEEFYILIA